MMDKEVIFADSSVQDYQSLLQGIDGAEIVILKENLSAIDQITQALADRKDIEAVHILSHGSEGSFQLGSEILNENKLENFSTQIKQWGNALTANGDILLYACDVAAGETGLNFVKKLSEITGADVAASNNITVSAAKGGDGELEVKFGEIETQPLNFANYNYTLAGLTGTADSKGINVSATPTSTAIDVLANDTGTGRLSVNSIVTGPTHGTAIINDSIYVGGWFTSIGGQTRNKIAKLNSDGTVDTVFNPNADGWYGPVNAIAIDSSGNLIVGGRFTSIGGQTRNNIAKLNPTTGAADTTFNPNANGDSFSAGDPNVDGSVSAIAIDPKKNILYTPNANFNGVDTFTYTAKDSSSVSTPITVNLLVNDSPVLDTSGTPTLTAINQGDTNNTGTLISTIIANFGGTKITDSDTDAKQGIAITNLDTTKGSWQYTTDGTTWNNTPAVSATNALLLASDANTKIRFLPSASYNGTVTNAITFAAWDQITGINGSTANYTTDQTNNTTSSVFSSATETADITIVNPFPIITSVSATTPNGTYSIGKNIDITVNFSQIVKVTGTPQLSLAGATPVASYLSGSDSNTLTFRYTVAAGDSSPDLDYLLTTALSLRGGTIKNAANGDAILTLPSPAATNSLGANKAIVIDTIVPTVISINRLTTSPTAAATATYEIKFSQDVIGVDTGDFTLVPTGVNGASIGDLNAVDPKTYQLQVNTGAGSGSISLNLTDNDSIKNILGVALGGANSGNGNLTGQIYDIDKTPPTGSLNAVADITIAGGSSQSLTVTFSDNNTVDVSSLDSYDALINLSGDDITAQFVSVDTNSSGTPRTATYSFTPPDGS